jgi:methionyl-tRNA formyltransferase
MRIVIITQDEPFYLSENLEYLVKILPNHSKIVGCVVTSASPYGKKESFYQKARKTAAIFGLNFFLRYALRFLWRKVGGSGSIRITLKKLGIQPINLDTGINHPSSLSKISEFKPDLLVSILGNEIFKKKLIELAPKGCLNLHTALLPKYRGLMPSFWVLRNDEKETGVSVFFVDEGIDSGPIIVQKRIFINGDSQEELIQRTKKMGMEAISEAIDLIQTDRVSLIANDASLMSYYSFPTKKDVNTFKANGKRFFR